MYGAAVFFLFIQSLRAFRLPKVFGCATLCVKWPELRAIGYLEFAYEICASLR